MDTSHVILTIPGLEGNEVASLTPIQAAIQPSVPVVIVFWWAIWIGMFLYMSTHYVVIPLFRSLK